MASSDGGTRLDGHRGHHVGGRRSATVAMLTNGTTFIATDGHLSGNNDFAHPLPAGTAILVGLDHAIIAISGDPRPAVSYAI
jgi:hypothetical protein